MRAIRMPAAIVAALAGLTTAGCTSLPAGEAPVAKKGGLERIAKDLESRGESGTAIALYQRAIAASGKSPDAYAGLGDVYLRSGSTRSATQAYKAALERDPKHPGALLGLGTIQLQQGNVDEALVALAGAAPQVNTSSAYNRLGVALTMSGRLEEAQKALSRALQLAPTDVDVRTNLALAAALAGRSQAAIATMRQVVSFSDVELRHHKNLIIVLVLAGHVDEAKKAAPSNLGSGEFQALVAKAKSIAKIDDARKRAKALGAIAG